MRRSRQACVCEALGHGCSLWPRKGSRAIREHMQTPKKAHEPSASNSTSFQSKVFCDSVIICLSCASVQSNSAVLQLFRQYFINCNTTLRSHCLFPIQIYQRHHPPIATVQQLTEWEKIRSPMWLDCYLPSLPFKALIHVPIHFGAYNHGVRKTSTKSPKVGLSSNQETFVGL